MDDDGPPGVPEWVVTYGDMMSLLFTFFIMLVSLSELQADKKFRAVLDSIQKQLGYRSAPISPPGVNFPLNAMIQQFDTLDSFSNKHKHRRGLRQESIVGDEIRVFRTRDGDAVLVGLRIPFTPGEAKLSKLARARLTVIVGKLAGRKNKVEIRAHTSPEPHPNSTTSLEKTDLSYARARCS
jgi:chemotaxis protein MotB